MQTMVARLPVIPMIRLETADACKSSELPDLDETACVA
jgi:hypothetical protein